MLLRLSSAKISSTVSWALWDWAWFKKRVSRPRLRSVNISDAQSGSLLDSDRSMICPVPREILALIAFCADKNAVIDYKDTNRLRRYVSERGKILPRRMTGTCAKHQRELAIAIKRARIIALLPFVND